MDWNTVNKKAFRSQFDSKRFLRKFNIQKQSLMKIPQETLEIYKTTKDWNVFHHNRSTSEFTACFSGYLLIRQNEPHMSAHSWNITDSSFWNILNMLGNSWPIPLDMYEWIEHGQVGLITLTLNLWIDLLLLWMPTNIKTLIPNPILVILLIYYYEGLLHTKNQLYVSNDYRDIGLLRILQSDCSIAFSVITQEWKICLICNL